MRWFHSRDGLLRHPDFRRVWVGQTVSEAGSQVSYLAIPLAAVSTLRASAFEVSLLVTMSRLPFLLFGLPAGAWCDRLRSRPVLIAGDLGRAAVLVSIPLAAAFGVLTTGQLIAAVFLAGALTVFFDVALQSYVPYLVGRARIVEANAKLEASEKVASIAGPAIGGFLVQALTAPFAILADALSFLWSVGWIRTIGMSEPPRTRRVGARLHHEIKEGLAFVFGHPTLRAIAGYGATYIFFSSAQTAIIIVFLVRSVHLSAVTIGLLGTLASVGGVAGALSASWIARTVGHGRALRVSVILTGVFGLLIPLSAPGARLGFYVVGSAIASYGIVSFNIIQVSFRQTVCPDHLLGRMNATMRFLLLGAVPFGSLLGGALASTIGLRPTLWVSAAGALLATLWLLFTPVAMPDFDEQPRSFVPSSARDLAKNSNHNERSSRLRSHF